MVPGANRLTPSVKAEGGLAKSTLSKTVNALLGWLCYAHATSYDFKEVFDYRTCDEKAYDAAICILPFGMMSLYERHGLHGYFSLRLFFDFLLLPFLRFFGTGFVHQYHLQYFLFGLNASLNSQYRVPAPLLL